MIKVIIERQFRQNEGPKAESVLIEMRSKALRAQGYVGGETLSSVEDPSVLLTISTWVDEASWKSWASSSERQEIARKIGSLTVSPEKVSVFRIVSGGGT
ncbi:MAG: antibiotic biosynthesis monooxygenase [Dehalococcoidia bacterium]